MTQHVYARLAGFGLRVIPRAPFTIWRVEPAGAVDVEHITFEEKLFARLIPHEGGYKSKLDQYTKSLFDVLDIENGPDIAEWRIETSVFTCGWPTGFAIVSNLFPKDPSPFDFTGAHGELIYVQSPQSIPSIEKLCAPHHSIVDIQRTDMCEWIDLAYDIDGVPWRQRNVIVKVLHRRLAVTMQSPEPYWETAGAAAIEIATSLAPYGDDEGAIGV